MTRLTIILLLLIMTACQPPAIVQREVLPTLVSVTVLEGNQLLLQGRYFGDGAAGAQSYVLLGVDADGHGGVRVDDAMHWSESRIILEIPPGAGRGFVFVVVDGVWSQGLPANLP